MKFRRWVPLWVLPVLLVFATGTVWLRLKIVRTTYAIHEADHSIQALRKGRERTELRLSNLRSPRRLEQLARARFGWGQPRSNQVVYVRSSVTP